MKLSQILTITVRGHYEILRRSNMDNVFEVKNLTKKYGKLTAVENISFEAGPKTVIGLVGPNGAGKTTTIKMMLGLVRPDSGEVYINGKSIKKDYENAIRKVSGIVEVPAFYPYLSGYNNLKIACNMYGMKDKKHLAEIVDMLGLTERIHDKVRKYSLGMKQRLGICRALISDPELLILDEPINGLDPEGIVQFRQLIEKIKNEKNCCIIISSHILSEIEKVCDKVIFINRGKAVNIAEASVEPLEDAYKIRTTTPHEIASFAASNEKFNTLPITENEDSVTVKANEDTVKQLIVALFSANIQVDGFEKAVASLEEDYMKFSHENTSAATKAEAASDGETTK